MYNSPSLDLTLVLANEKIEYVPGSRHESGAEP